MREFSQKSNGVLETSIASMSSYNEIPGMKLHYNLFIYIDEKKS